MVQPKFLNSAPGNVIIHLPPGPLFQGLSKTGNHSPEKAINDGSSSSSIFHASEDQVSASDLANTASSTVVTINYRLGEKPFDEEQIPLASRLKIQRGEDKPQNLYYQFPTPVHDTLAGFDWILQTLQPKRLGAVGSHIGGSLALMLALTEPRSVHAVAAADPVCDWTSLDEYCRASSASIPKRKQAPKDLIPLLEARERFFTTQEKYFDSFASPVLFLRSAGKDTPKVFPKYLTGPEHPVPVLISKEPAGLQESQDAYAPDDTFHDEIGTFSDVDSGYGSNDESDDSPAPRRRKALSRWPPYGLDYGNAGPPERYSRQPIERLEVTLPWVRVFSTTHERLQDRENTADPSPPLQESESETDHTDRRAPTKRKRNQNHTVLTHQAAEMVDVMRRACFFGREKGFSEERVTLSSLPAFVPSAESDSRMSGGSSGSDIRSGIEPGFRTVTSYTGEWLAETFTYDEGIDSGLDSDDSDGDRDLSS